MQCPECNNKIEISDRFCEECGAPLTVNNTAIKTTGECSKCGAGADCIDTEGFCSQCGFRNQVAGKDYFEVISGHKLAGACDRGLRHAHNEDYVACDYIEDKNTYIMVVCDGVSSSQSPELASKAAAKDTCTALRNAIQNNLPAKTAISLGIAAAFRAVCSIPYIKGKDEDPPSTTLVAAIIQNRNATICWLGDSRAYWISGNNSQQLTEDDSWMNDMVKSGKITPIEASKSVNAHAITRWIGADAINDPEPSIINFDIPDSGYLLLCSDGLWNYAPQATQLTAIIQQISSTEPLIIARKLVEFARSQGGQDNITVAVFYSIGK